MKKISSYVHVSTRMIQDGFLNEMSVGISMGHEAFSARLALCWLSQRAFSGVIRRAIPEGVASCGTRIPLKICFAIVHPMLKLNKKIPKNTPTRQGYWRAGEMLRGMFALSITGLRFSDGWRFDAHGFFYCSIWCCLRRRRFLCFCSHFFCVDISFRLFHRQVETSFFI